MCPIVIKRAIQRAFTELIQEGKISALGSARARSYIRSTGTALKAEVKPVAFQGISLAGSFNARTPTYLTAIKNSHTCWVSTDFFKELRS